MSLVSAANAGVARRSDYEPRKGTLRGTAQIAVVAEDAAAIPPERGSGVPPPPDVSAFLKTATTYVPTEVITVYLAFLNAIEHRDCGSRALLCLLLGFAVATPLLVLTLFAIRLRADGKALPRKPSEWPAWEMSASLAAFLAWAIAMPANPFARCSAFSPTVAGAALVAVTALLGVLAPLFQRPLATPVQ